MTRPARPRDSELPDGDPSWRAVLLGDLDPTTGGCSVDEPPCLWDFRPAAPYRCTRVTHRDPWHVATDGGRVVAVLTTAAAVSETTKRTGT